MRRRVPVQPLPNPCVRQIGNTKNYEITEEYRLRLPGRWSHLILVMPYRWTYNRASIPDLVPPWFISKDDLGCLPPGPHDAGYDVKGEFTVPIFATAKVPTPYIIDSRTGEIVAYTFSRFEIDLIFLLLMLQQRVVTWKAKAAYWAVRLFNPEWEREKTC